MTKANFISLEGLESSGKSLISNWLVDFLTAKKIPCIPTKEPGGTVLGEKINNLLKNTNSQMTANTELLLFTSSRIEHIEKTIKPNLQKGIWVICDRFIDSTIAYQNGGRNIPMANINTLNNMFLPNIKPDITFFLDITVQESIKRIEKRQKLDRIEKESYDFFCRVYNSYQNIIKQNKQRIKVVNTMQSIDNTKNEIIKYLLDLIE